MSEDYSGVLLITDIDGTLVWDGELSKENIEAIRRFTQNGGKFTVATGRSGEYIKEHYLPELCINAPIAAINGTVVSGTDGHIMWKRPLRSGFSRIVEEAYSTCGDIEKILRYRMDETVFCPRGFREDDKEECFKLLIVTGCEESALKLQAHLNQKYGSRYVFMRSWPTGLEVIEHDAGKGKCLKKIREAAGAQTVIAMGDFENDITLFEEADISIAVENAVPILKEAADMVTVSGKNNAVSQVIADLPHILKK